MCVVVCYVLLLFVMCVCDLCDVCDVCAKDNSSARNGVSPGANEKIFSECY